MAKPDCHRMARVVVMVHGPQKPGAAGWMLAGQMKAADQKDRQTVRQLAAGVVAVVDDRQIVATDHKQAAPVHQMGIGLV
jgi:hypothetical protein